MTPRNKYQLLPQLDCTEEEWAIWCTHNYPEPAPGAMEVFDERLERLKKEIADSWSHEERVFRASCGPLANSSALGRKLRSRSEEQVANWKEKFKECDWSQPKFFHCLSYYAEHPETPWWKYCDLYGVAGNTTPRKLRAGGYMDFEMKRLPRRNAVFSGGCWRSTKTMAAWAVTAKGKEKLEELKGSLNTKH